MKKGLRFLCVIAFAFVTMFALTSCAKKAEPVDANTITYDGKTFNWQDAANAASYLVKVNEGSELSVASSTYAYAAKKADETVTIQIKSVNEKGDANDTAASKSFTRLETITEIRFDDEGNAEWDSVDGATEYIVKLNGKETRTTVCSLAKEDFIAGQKNTLQVKPYSATGFADFSQQYTKTYLAAPTDIRFDGNNISWKGSSLVTGGYQVFINGGEYETTKSTSIAYDSANQSFDISVIALGDSGASKNTFSSVESETVSYVYLETVQDLRVEEGHLVWTPIESANGYELRIDGGKVETLTETKYKLTPGVSHSYEVKPIVSDGAHYFSSYCVELIAKVLKAPELLWNDSISLDAGDSKNNLYWTQVSGEVSGYTVRITLKADGQVHELDDVPLGATVTQFEYGYNQVGEYTISVQTKATDNGTDYDSAFSAPITVIRLAAPKLDSVSSNPNSLANGFTINLDTTTSSGASGYKLYKEGLEVPNVTYDKTQIKVPTVVEASDVEGHDFTYGVQSIGKPLQTVSGKKVVVLNSILRENLDVPITVLAAPRNVKFEGFDASWDVVPDAQNGYAVSISDSPVMQATYSLLNLSAGPVKFSVIARGNGQAILASKPTNEYNVIRLQAPSSGSVRVSEDHDEHMLTWTPVTNALSYQLTFNGTQEATATKASLSVDKYIDDRGLVINIISVANYYEDENNLTYYVTSQAMQNPVTMLKLSQPTFGDIKVQGGYLVWNSPTDVNLGEYTPTYRVYDANNNIAFDSTYASQQFNLKEHCEPGTLQFAIRALGDGQKFLDSDKSDAIVVTYLATPEVTRVGNQYVWDAVVSAREYNVYIQGKLVANIKSVTGQASYAYDVDLSKFPTQGEYQISVVAVGDGGYTTADSEPCVILQQVKLEDVPVFTLSYTDQNGNLLSNYDQNGRLTVTITTPSEHSTGYVINYGGTKTKVNDIDSLVNTFAPGTPGTYNVYVYAKGGLFDEQGNLYIASNKTNTQTMILLSRVSGITFNASTISWSHSPADGRSKFELSIELKNGNTVNMSTTQTSISYNDIAKEIGGGATVAATDVVSITITAIARSGSISSTPVTEVR